MQLPLVLDRQMSRREDVLRGVFQHGGRARKPRAPAVGDLPQLGHRRGVVRLREDGADDRRDGFAGAVGDGGQEVAHDVHAAPLPGAAGEHGGDRLLHAFMRVRADQTDAVEAPLHQAAQEGGPERAILGRTDVDAEHLPLALIGVRQPRS